MSRDDDESRVDDDTVIHQKTNRHCVCIHTQVPDFSLEHIIITLVVVVVVLVVLDGCGGCWDGVRGLVIVAETIVSMRLQAE